MGTRRDRLCRGVPRHMERLRSVGFKHILFGRSDVLGLDVGCASVKMIGLRKDDAGYAVTAAGIAEIEASEENGGLIQRRDTVRAIRRCIAQTAVRTKLVVCSLSGPEVVVRDFEFPSMVAEEIQGAIELEASEVCPFNTGYSAVDYQLMPDEGAEVHGILVAATNDLIDDRLNVAKEASLDCAIIDVDGLALLNCFTEFEKPEPGKAVFILNIGSERATVAILSEEGRPFVRDMTYAGNAIIELIASENECSVEDVRRVLVGGTAEELAPFRDSLRRACRKIADDVRSTSRFHKSQHNTGEFECVHVCGGFALVDGFVETLNEELPIEAKIWNPFEKVRLDPKRKRNESEAEDILRSQGPAMAVAAGLALRTV